MIFDRVNFADPTTLLVIAASITVLSLLSTYYYRGLNKYPGPFLASLTPAYRAWHAYFSRGGSRVWELSLHEKYGPIVRIAPDVLSFSNPDVVAHIYQRDFHKSDHYLAHAALVQGKLKTTIVSEPDFINHDQIRRSIDKTFTMNSISKHEEKITSTIDLLVEKLSGLAQKSTSFDLTNWTTYFATDVISEVTYGKSYGSLEAGKDLLKIRKSTLENNRQANIWRKWPILDYLQRTNPLAIYLNKAGIAQASQDPAVPIVRKHLEERLALEGSGLKHDLTAEFQFTQKLFPDIMTDDALSTLALTLTTVGSDPTSTTISLIMYYLMKHPQVYAQLEKEVATLFSSGSKTASAFSYKDAAALPYLDAVIKETFRYHPAQSVFLERKTPAAGCWITAIEFPLGVVVGTSPAIVGRDKKFYGDDANYWRPERWLEADEARRIKWESRQFAFGEGVFTCLGKNIALISIYKIVPCLLQNFKLKLADQSREPFMENSIFHHVEGVKVTLSRK